MHADRTGTGVFCLGVAIIAVLDWWWPGALFAAGAGFAARAHVMGGDLRADRYTLLALFFGVVVLVRDVLAAVGLDILWPVALVLMGTALLVRVDLREESETENP